MLFFPYCVGLFTNGAKAMFGKTFDSFAIVTCSHYIPHLQKKPLKASKLLILIISNLISNFNPWVLIFLIILWPNGRSAKRTCTPYKLSQGGEVEGEKKKTNKLVWLSSVVSWTRQLFLRASSLPERAR